MTFSLVSNILEVYDATLLFFLLQGIIYGLLNKKKEAEEQFEIYRSLVPEEFPQRGFLDDIVLAAKKGSGQPF